MIIPLSIFSKALKTVLATMKNSLKVLQRDPDISAGDEISYFIADGDGTLPPGITLSEDGRLQGVTEALLSLDPRTEAGGYDDQPYGDLPLDFAAVSSSGFDSFYYDTYDFDYSIATNQPKKLNRYYSFAVTVTDGDSFTKREFTIYLVGDDYLKSDNTAYHSKFPLGTATGAATRINKVRT